MVINISGTFHLTVSGQAPVVKRESNGQPGKPVLNPGKLKYRSDKYVLPVLINVFI